MAEFSNEEYLRALADNSWNKRKRKKGTTFKKKRKKL